MSGEEIFSIAFHGTLGVYAGSFVAGICFLAFLWIMSWFKGP